MLVLAFFSWWYGDGWKQVIRGFTPRLTGLLTTFSVVQLLQTLFAPWRRIISYPGASFNERFRAWTDNIFSRIIGFVVRLLVLFAAFITVIICALATIVEIIIWPLLPLAVPGGIIAGFII